MKNLTSIFQTENMLKSIKIVLKARRKVNESWRLPRNFDRISTYFRTNTAGKHSQIVDDRTWYDLDMDTIYSNIDSTVTGIGRQYLYNKMRTFSSDEKPPNQNINHIKDFQNSAGKKDKLLKALSIIDDEDGVAVTKLLFDGLPPIYFPKKSIFWTAICVVLLSISIIYPKTLALFAFAAVTNFFFSQYLENKTGRFSTGIYFLYKMVKSFNQIAKNFPSQIKDKKFTVESRKSMLRLELELLILAHGQSSFRLISSYVSYIVNLIFLYEFVAWAFFYNHIRKDIALLQACYTQIGKLDSNLAIATYLDKNSNLCQPKFVDTMDIKVSEMHHPIIKNSVPNSFFNQSLSGMITGSNMAGKTSFIKAIGVNYLLARTLGICHAESATFPLVDIYSSIKTSDSLENGESYYFAELDRIKNFLNYSSDNHRCLFLIDEIFRGTNTIERVASAAAVLRALAGKSLILVTTHDTELKQHLEQKYKMWYFEETGDPGKPYDYKLKSGVCRTNNAIKLMENIGYPSNIVKEARAIAKGY